MSNHSYANTLGNTNIFHRFYVVRYFHRGKHKTSLFNKDRLTEQILTGVALVLAYLNL